MIDNEDDKGKFLTAIRLLKEINIDGESTQELLGKIGMGDQILRQLVLTSPKAQTHALLYEKREIDGILEKRIYNQTESFLLVAVAGSCLGVAKKEFGAFQEDVGMAGLYDLILDVFDEMLFTENSEYQKYLQTEDKEDWFIKNHGTCMDWYFMEEGVKLLKARLEGYEGMITNCLLCGKDTYNKKNFSGVCDKCATVIFQQKSKDLIKLSKK